MLALSNKEHLLPLVVKIVSAHVSNNSLNADALPPLIDSVFRALSDVGNPKAPTGDPKPTPAVDIKKSVFPGYLICLEDGKKLQTLRRHLSTAFGLTPEAYRERWGLPSDYPMVAPKYAAKRSELAKAAGLGRFGRVATKSPQNAEGPPIQKVPEGVRGKRLPRQAR